VRYRADDCLVFGGESRGLPDELRGELAPLYRIPLAEPRVRSLNLSNAVSIVVFEALRQRGAV
jgi:tRNA (cytidine/uridine-2'-O-)-methyltransferase